MRLIGIILSGILPLYCLFQPEPMANRSEWISYAILINLIGFTAIYIDKRRACQGRHRISESTLHLFEFAGGWLGSGLSQEIFRHKTIKTSYNLVFWTIILLYQLALLDWISGHRIIQLLRP